MKKLLAVGAILTTGLLGGCVVAPYDPYYGAPGYYGGAPYYSGSVYIDSGPRYRGGGRYRRW